MGSLPITKFLFFGGKGGVGKTTCAAARAVAEADAGRRVLVVSTDPAHSLADAFKTRLTSRPRTIPDRGGRLRALQLDAPRAFARWLRAHRAALSDILEHGTWLDDEDIDALLDLPIPGIDELSGILELAELAKPESPYERIVVDTAPTGHTLRLLAAPETVGAVAHVLDSLQERHRAIRQQLARVTRPEAADRLIELLAAEAAESAALLRDRRRTEFHWVTLPERLALAETEDALAALGRAGIDVAGIIVNRMLPDAEPCPICKRRRAEERAVLARLREDLGKRRRVRVLADELEEPRGTKALRRLGRSLVSRSPFDKLRVSGLPKRVPPQRSSLVVSLSNHERTMAADSLRAFADATLLFFGGKGGVGKTTTAAAIAVRLARARPDRRVLLLSTDPAHSLGDVFDADIGDEPTVPPGAPENLFVREVDARRALDRRREPIRAALGEVATAFGNVSVARAAELTDLAPPGIDELFGILTVVAARQQFETLVVDAAPTGHALRLLEMPATAREWIRVILRVLLKYKSLVPPGPLAAELIDVSKSIRELQALVENGGATRFVVVTRAASIAWAETERLIGRLRKLRLAIPALVVNAMTLASGGCARCTATASAERRQLSAIRRRVRSRLPRCVIIQTPLWAPPPRGVKELNAWGGSWVVDTIRRTLD